MASDVLASIFNDHNYSTSFANSLNNLTYDNQSLLIIQPDVSHECTGKQIDDTNNLKLFNLNDKKNNGLSTSDTNLMQIKQPRIISRKRYNDSSLPESIIKNKRVNKLNTQKQASKRYRMKKRNEEMIIFEKIKIEASKYESLLNLKNQCQIAIRNVLEYVLDKVQITDKISLIQNFRKNGLKYCTEHLYELLSNMVMAKIDLNEANNAYNDINDENILNINDPHLESIVNHIPVEIENVDKDTQLNEFQELFDNGADNMNELKLNLNLTLLSSSKMLLVNGPME